MIATFGGLALLLPLASVLGSPVVPLPLRALVVALWLLALLRPHAAFLTLVVVIPLASEIMTMSGAPPIRYAEALVIAVISGALIAAARPRLTRLEPQPPAVAPAAAVLAAALLCSAAVTIAASEIGTRTPSLFLRSFLYFLARDYLAGSSSAFAGVPGAIVLAEAIALLLLAANHARDGVARPVQLLIAFAAAFVLTLVAALVRPGTNQIDVAGEIGVVGLAPLAWLLTAASVRVTNGLRAFSADRLLAGAAVALVAFAAMYAVVRLVPAESIYLSWILLGVAIARADGDAQPPYADDDQRGDRRARGEFMPRTNSAISAISALNVVRVQWVVSAVAITALVLSVPVRANVRSAAFDLSRQTFGFYDWEGEAAERFRWTSGRATFFVPAAVHEMWVPVRAIRAANGAPIDLSVAVGGRIVRNLLLADEDWVPVRVRLPFDPDAGTRRRIDILAQPTWPASLLGNPDDARRFGVQVGELGEARQP